MKINHCTSDGGQRRGGGQGLLFWKLELWAYGRYSFLFPADPVSTQVLEVQGVMLPGHRVQRPPLDRVSGGELRNKRGVHYWCAGASGVSLCCPHVPKTTPAAGGSPPVGSTGETKPLLLRWLSLSGRRGNLRCASARPPRGALI